MATLHVENIPDDLYAALRKQAKSRRNSLAKEVISLLEVQVPTPQRLKRRRELFQKALRLSAQLASTSSHPRKKCRVQDHKR